jgi:hypothetical protein
MNIILRSKKDKVYRVFSVLLAVAVGEEGGEGQGARGGGARYTYRKNEHIESGHLSVHFSHYLFSLEDTRGATCPDLHH